MIRTITDKSKVVKTSKFDTPRICPNNKSSTLNEICLNIDNKIKPKANNEENMIPIAVSSPIFDLLIRYPIIKAINIAAGMAAITTLTVSYTHLTLPTSDLV